MVDRKHAVQWTAVTKSGSKKDRFLICVYGESHTFHDAASRRTSPPPSSSSADGSGTRLVYIPRRTGKPVLKKKQPRYNNSIIGTRYYLSFASF